MLAMAVAAPLAAMPAIAQENEPGEEQARECDTADDIESVDQSAPNQANKKKNRKNNAGDDADRDLAEPCEPEPQQVSLANLISPPPAAVDHDLQAALATVGFLDTWYSVTPTHPPTTITGGGHQPNIRRGPPGCVDLIDELIGNRETTTILFNATQVAVAQRRAVDRTIESIDEAVSGLRSDRHAAEDRLAVLEDRLDEVVAAIQNAAVGAYVSENAPGATGLENITDYNDREELAVQVGPTFEEFLVQRANLERAIADQELEIADIDAAIDAAQQQRSDSEARGTALDGTVALLSAEIAELTTRRIEVEQGFPQVIGDAHKARLLATAPALNVSLVTLDAYVQAADDIEACYPQCQIRWEMLAGIARVESAHATFGGAAVAPNGDLS